MIEACKNCEHVRYCINGYRCMKMNIYLEHLNNETELCKRDKNEEI